MNSTRKLLVMTTLAVLSISSFLVAGSAYAVSILPVDTMLQQAYLRMQNDNFSSLTKNLSKDGNLFDSAYNLARKQSLGTVSDTFSSIASNMNSQHNCALTPGDIANVAASDPYLNSSLADLGGKQTFAVGSGDLVRSCIRIAQCSQGVKAASASALSNAYTVGTFPLCRQVVQDAYANTVSLISQQTRMDAANHGDDIFYNGTLDDSPFDLLVDMQHIGDVLFKSNTEAPEVVLYDFPNSSNGNSTFFGQGGTNLGLGSLNIGNLLGNGSSSSNSTNSANNTTITSTSISTSAGATKGATSAISASPANSLAAQQTSAAIGKTQTAALQNLSAYYQTINKVNSAAATTTPTTTSPTSTPQQQTIYTTTSNGLACTTASTPVKQTLVQTQEEVMATQIEQATNLEQAVNIYNTAINSPLALSNALASPAMQQNTATESAIANLGNSSANGNGAGNDNPNNAANSCISQCSTLAPADKAVCEAKCLCGTKYSKDGIFGISVCTVPTYQTTSIANGKSVKSVEEIVDEINNVLTALRNSGQLMKHTKSTEFLDTSLRKMKLNQILSFDMNVAFKPIYNSNTQKEKKEAQKSENNAIADRARQGSYMDGKVGEEKNKYVILSNPVKANQQASTLSVNDSPAPASEINAAFPYDLAKTLNNDMLNAINTFVQKNELLWQQIGETMNAINTTADNLKKKIEKAKS